jgi:hypothetical protein
MPLDLAELNDLIDEKILTGGRRTSASNLREVLHEIVEFADSLSGGGGGNSFINGGNAFGANAILGLTDSYDLTIQTDASLILNGNVIALTSVNGASIASTSMVIQAIEGYGIELNSNTGFPIILQGSAFDFLRSDGLYKATFDVNEITADRIITFQDKNITVAGTANETFTGTTTFSSLNASTVPYLDGSKNLVSSTVTPTELGYLSGVTSGIQAQFNALVSGLSWKQAVRAATTANIILSGAQTIDGVSIIAGDRVLVKNQTAPAENGIWVCSAGAWARSSDMDLAAEFPSATVAISEGSTQQDTQYVCSTDLPITLGTTAISWVLVGGTTYTGTTNRLTVTGSVLDISASYIGQSSITTLGTITSGIWNAGSVTSSGVITAASGLVGSPGFSIGGATTGIYSPAGNQISIAANGINIFTFTTGLVSSTRALSVTGNITSTTGNNVFTLSNTSSATIANNTLTLNGTYQTANVSGGTGLYRGLFISHTLNLTGSSDHTVTLIDINPSITSLVAANTLYGIRSQIAAGTGTRYNIFADGTAPNKFGGPVEFPSFTVATLPAATAARFIYVSDETGGPIMAFSDGTNWRRVTDRAIIS